MADRSSYRQHLHHRLHGITRHLLAVTKGWYPQCWMLIPSVSWPQLWVSKERIAIPVPSHLTSHHPRRIFCQALLPAYLDKEKKRERWFFTHVSAGSCACTAVTNTHTYTACKTTAHNCTFTHRITIIRSFIEENIHHKILFLHSVNNIIHGII